MPVEVGPEGSAMPSPSPAGDAGKAFLADLFSTPVDAAGAAKVANGGDELKTLALGGGFAVNEEGYQAYLKACDFFLDGYKHHRAAIYVLTAKAQMGSSQYANAVADFNVKAADGDPQSLLPNLDLMRDGIERAKEALLIARKNYRETEEAHNLTFTQMNKEIS